MSEWKLIDLCIGKGKYGIAAPSVPKNENLPTYLRITDINDDGTINKASLCSVDDENSTNYILEENDIVFARTGNSTGRSYFYNKNDGELVYAGFLIKFSLNPNIVNPVILKYYTHSKPYYDWIYSFDTGATRGNINAQTYANMPVILPERDIQDIIVPILYSLDAKIETNNKLNEKLEEMAQAIFKSWFVDFEPFKDQPFHETELGMIPDGWEVKRISENDFYITDFVSNGSFASLKQNVSLLDYPDYAYFIRNTDLKEGSFKVYVNKDSYDFLSKSKLLGGEIIISNVGDVGSVFLCPRLDKPMTLGNNIIMIKLKDEIFKYYLFQFFSSHIGQHLIDGISGGSVQRKFNKTDFRAMKIMIPSINVLSNYHSVIKSVFDFKEMIRIENDRLASLRDTLLPRLMSGEIKI